MGKLDCGAQGLKKKSTKKTGERFCLFVLPLTCSIIRNKVLLSTLPSNWVLYSFLIIKKFKNFF